MEEERNIYQEQYQKLLKQKKSSSNIGSLEDVEDENNKLNQKYIDSRNSVEELTDHVNEKIDNIRKDLLTDFNELAGKIQPLQVKELIINIYILIISSIMENHNFINIFFF